MTKRKTAVIVLAAGRGTRMKSSLPKVLHTLAGRPMLNHLLGQVEKLKPSKVVVVVAPGMAKVAEAASPHPTGVQQKQHGTADAVQAAEPEPDGFDGGVLVPRHDSVLGGRHRPDSEVVVEWRALTVALLDRIAGMVRARLGQDATTLPLSAVLQGGTWAAGRRLARERRADGGPPLAIESDGTVF